MAHPAFRWSRLLIITTVLVVTAGVAAAPFRETWLPLAARPLDYWNVGGTKVPSIAPLLVARDVVTPQGMIDAPFLVAPDRLEHRYYQSRQSDNRWREARREYESYWSSQTSNRRAGGNSRVTRNGSGGGGGAGLGRVSGGSSPGARSGSYNRDNSPNNSGNSRNSGSSNSRSNGGGGGGGGGGDRGTSAKNDDGVFGEHKKGLPDLNGRGGLGIDELGGRGGRGGKLAATPEPSSLLLFGTGIVAAAGALRRRLRRQ